MAGPHPGDAENLVASQITKLSSGEVLVWCRRPGGISES